MKFKNLLIFLVVIVSVFTFSYKITQAQAPDLDSEISGKLDAIASDQKVILQELAAIKQELYIIKIRITQAQ